MICIYAHLPVECFAVFNAVQLAQSSSVVGISCIGNDDGPVEWKRCSYIFDQYMQHAAI